MFLDDRGSLPITEDACGRIKLMVIRTGLLGIGAANNPILDNHALDAVSEQLHARLPDVAIMLTQVAGSQRHWLADILTRWCDEEELDLVLTVGGTLPAAGPSGNEITPDATRDVLERDLPGLAEAMRVHAGAETRLALLDRSVCGIRGRTLLLNLPSGAATAVLFLSGVIDLIPAALAHLQELDNAPLPEDELDFL